MTIADYYRILEIPLNSSIDDIKKAYRQKARQYHPDINPTPEAKDLFIMATEAYEFLISYMQRSADDDEEYRRAMEDWRKYRQERSRRRARAYAQTSYNRFRNTKFYRTTRILDGTTIIFSLIISIMVITYTIIGYTYRLHHPLPDLEKPSILAFLMLLAMGMLFFVVSLVFLKVHQENSKKHRAKNNKTA